MKKIITLILLSLGIAKAQSTDTTLTIYPNPFQTTATIEFQANLNDTITLSILDPFGQVLQTYFNNTTLPTGNYSITLQGDTLADGAYYVKLKKGTANTIGKLIIKEQSTSSITDNTKSNNTFTIFPNPSNSIINISYTHKTNTKTDIQIINSQGQTVKEINENQTAGKQAITIDTKQFAKGLYIIKLKVGENIEQTKIIIQ